ncbi:metal ABC transporter substrate-binding protein [Pseudomonas lalucatii]|uniref:Metal ABC transporter substrate-binding protein n=1 Tax=Pseudomonas lalucatii TaxID=1424203 RepID=A0ABS5Q1R2_9PSED|nr:metal ABC transporter substrate-binding protein [Pseudomonas lalucatii]MBS7662681.1 metal ABC transporter substrate-binding protein [Pseudomonas lalucatii]MBS7725766.1 metal ABC transporter substrate-binding protein [Pseudomonas lalucatii]QVM88619.1 metal ABC transporter substrate-binding protein [Pseudomonas lalucatii]
MRTLIALFTLLASLSLAAAEKLQVITSFSILADITQQIAGDRIELHNLVGADADAHVYAPSAEDAKAVLDADLIIANGLGFEPWLDRLIASSDAAGTRIDASSGVLALMLDEDGHQVADPHAWQNLANAEIYVSNIAKALSQADPAHATYYTARRDAYLGEIRALLSEARTGLGQLPQAQRSIITSHDAFGYLGQAYGLKFIAPQGLSSEDQPSAAEVAALIRQIRADGVRAVFVENIRDPRLIQQIAAEGGAKVGGTLYSDALASEGPASSYLGMFKHNLDTLLAALKP